LDPPEALPNSTDLFILYDTAKQGKIMARSKRKRIRKRHMQDVKLKKRKERKKQRENA
jgi:hypothetical protein